MLERGSENEVGEFVHINYKNPVKIQVPSDSADLITSNQGLHHFPQDTIKPFLLEVNRILRKGGLFMIRVHDGPSDLIPVLDLAHSVLNAVTGVSVADEWKKIRGFRPILEWRRIIESAGLNDTQFYYMGRGDPTIDEMMCFYRDYLLQSPTMFSSQSVLDQMEVKENSQTSLRKKKPEVSGIFAKRFESYKETIQNNGPHFTLVINKTAMDQILSGLLNLTETLKSTKLGLEEGQQSCVQQMLSKILRPTTDMSTAFQSRLYKGKAKRADINLAPKETFVHAKALTNEIKEGNAAPAELIITGVIKDPQEPFNSNLDNSTEDSQEAIEVQGEVVQCRDGVVVQQNKPQDRKED